MLPGLKSAYAVGRVSDMLVNDRSFTTLPFLASAQFEVLLMHVGEYSIIKDRY